MGERGCGRADGDVVLRRLDRVVAREIAGETLLVPIRASVADVHHVYSLNPVAARVWSGLDGVRPRSALVASVCEAFDVHPDTAAREVGEFLEELLQAGLVREV